MIGRKDIGRVDVPSKVNGTATYGIDVQVPGMVYATVLQTPMDGAKAEGINTDEVMKIKGVTKVIPLPFGVAVVGDTVEATRLARNALKVKWDLSKSKAAPFDSEKAKEEYASKAKDPNIEGEGVVQGRRRGEGARQRRQGAGSRLLVRAHLPRPDGADERGGEGRPTTASRRRSGSARRCSRSRPRWSRAR